MVISSTIACVIVTYGPEMQEFTKLLSQLLKSNISIMVVDNWLSNQCTQTLKEICSKHGERIQFIPLKKNYGIAKALNIGISAAQDAGHSWVLLLDQDSLPQDGLLEELEVVVSNLENTLEKIVAIGPRLYDPRSKKFHSWAYIKWGLWRKTEAPTGTRKWIPCEFINSSGSLINLRYFKKIGPFREGFFIDHVETEWYMRARQLGLKCYGYDSHSYILHHMGDDVCRYWFFGWNYIPRRSPERHYTIVRNAIWMWRFKYVPISWAINNCLKIAFTLLYFSLFDKEKSRQFCWILKGIKDGLFLKIEDRTNTNKT